MSSETLDARAQALRTPSEVEAFLRQHADCALFKAGSCHRTDSALAVVGDVLARAPALPVGLIRVVEARAASQRAAELTGVRHASPQIVLMRDGRVVHARDNWDISGDALGEAIEQYLQTGTP